MQVPASSIAAANIKSRESHTTGDERDRKAGAGAYDYFTALPKRRLKLERIMDSKA